MRRSLVRTIDFMLANSEMVGECRVWRGRMNPTGYGGVWHDGKDWGAHRLMYVLLHGPLESGVMVLHRCDNPPCIHPEHLYAGTGHDNMRDMARRGRHRAMVFPGETNGRAKLTAGDVREIRGSCLGNSFLARQFAVNYSTIHRIRNGKRWA